MPAICAIIITCLPCRGDGSASRRPEIPKQELKILDVAINKSKQFDALKLQQIDSLKKAAENIPADDATRRLEAVLTIADQYLTTNADSALAYARRGIELSNHTPNGQANAKIAYINALSVSGIFSPALSELDSVQRLPLDKKQKIEMWKSGRRLYSYMMSYVSEKSPIYATYGQKYIEFDDSLLTSLPKTDNFYFFLKCERAVADGKYKEAKKMLETLLDRLPVKSNLYGIAAFQMAEVYRNQGDETMYASFLAKAAVSDIEAAVKEGLALPTLANWLYLQGHLNEAFEYINFALEDATNSNARVRAVAIAPVIPLIDEAYRKQISDTHDRLVTWAFLASFLLILTAVLLFYLGRQIRRSRQSQQKLESVSQIQESYIGNFVSLCSSYADRLDSLCRLVAVKVAAGQTDELLKLIKSGRFGESKDEEFFRKFDEAFLDLYPDFVMKVNQLLREEEQIMLKKDEGLSPELRIYAFVKLGVEESTRIAQILHYSVSTIYAYRNKMRNKAINRETFEADIVAIKRH